DHGSEHCKHSSFQNFEKRLKNIRPILKLRTDEELTRCLRLLRLAMESWVTWVKSARQFHGDDEEQERMERERKERERMEREHMEQERSSIESRRARARKALGRGAAVGLGYPRF
ncbi:unnamed protein product, partial [Nesidiocoris tenuis]